MCVLLLFMMFFLRGCIAIFFFFCVLISVFCLTCASAWFMPYIGYSFYVALCSLFPYSCDFVSCLYLTVNIIVKCVILCVVLVQLVYVCFLFVQCEQMLLSLFKTPAVTFYYYFFHSLANTLSTRCIFHSSPRSSAYTEPLNFTVTTSSSVICRG